MVRRCYSTRAKRTIVTTPDDRLKETRAVSAGTPKPGAGAPIGNGHRGAEGYAEECKHHTGQNAVPIAVRTVTVRDTARRTDVESEGNSGVPTVGAPSYDACEGDFRAHHQLNAARRLGPYEIYRVVYRYGYDLGANPRYCTAEWATVEQVARPRWEERNPGTREQFKETIRYAWDTARGQN
jgi:hypothetical protein